MIVDSKTQNGNILIYLIGAIFLLGLLTVIVRGSFQPGAGIDAESNSILAAQVRAFGTQVENGVSAVLQTQSESDLRFANPSSTIYGVVGSVPARQVFDTGGGGIEYRSPPAGINDGSQWQFYGNTHVYNLGSNDTNARRSELVLVLPNVTEPFCTALNISVGQTIDLTQFADPTSAGCIDSASHFTGTFTDGASANTLDETRFSALPPKEACIRCQSGNRLHYYRVLSVR
jgi:hypothetical protein